MKYNQISELSCNIPATINISQALRRKARKSAAAASHNMLYYHLEQRWVSYSALKQSIHTQ